MSENSGLWTTSASPTGHQVASYSQVVLSRFSEILAACSGFEGVAPGYGNELELTVTGANTVAVNTGGGVVDGKFYENSASESINIPSASAGNTRIDRIVLRADWSGFKVSLYRIAGTAGGSPAPPAITQAPGTTYDIMLYQVRVTDAGVVTIELDERVFAAGNTNSLGTGAVTNAKIATKAVDYDQVGAKIPKMPYRQGGHSTLWHTPGENNYDPGDMMIQAGVIDASFAYGETEITVSVTYPSPFGSSAILISNYAASSLEVHNEMPTIRYSSITQSKFTANLKRSRTEALTGVIRWLAIGPE